MEPSVQQLITEVSNELAVSSLTFSFREMTTGNFPYVASIHFNDGRQISIKANILKELLYFIPEPPKDKTVWTKEELDYLPILIGFWESYAHLRQTKGCFTQAGLFHAAGLYDQTTPYFQQSEYIFIPIAKTKLLQLLNVIPKTSDIWLKDYGEVHAHTILHQYQSLCDAIHQFEQKQPLLHLLDNPRGSHFHFRYYYFGNQGQIDLQHTDGYFSIIEPTLNVVVPVPPDTDVATQVDAFFTQIEQKSRIKNLYNPPKYFFKLLLNSVSFHLTTSAITAIYDSLLTKLTPDEIERKCATSYRNKEDELYITSHFTVQFLRFSDYLFLIKKNELVHFDDITNIESCFSLYESLVKKALDKELCEKKTYLLR